MKFAICAISLSFSLLAIPAAAQNCPAGYPIYCGNNRCCPSSATICCPGGGCCNSSTPICGSDNRCRSSGGGGGGGCPSGQVTCGTGYCIPTGTVCCASAGYAGRYCDSGETCTSDGRCQTSGGGGGGGGGGCPSGSYSCGSDYCAPDGSVCCASAGRPDIYCPSGSTCTSSGSCQGSGSGGGSSTGGTCPSGSTRCGTDYCTPTDSVCCASAGHPELYCPSASTCTADGRCNSGSGSSGGGSGGGGSGGGGPTGPGSTGYVFGCATTPMTTSPGWLVLALFGLFALGLRRRRQGLLLVALGLLAAGCVAEVGDPAPHDLGLTNRAIVNEVELAHSPSSGAHPSAPLIHDAREAQTLEQAWTGRAGLVVGDLEPASSPADPGVAQAASPTVEGLDLGPLDHPAFRSLHRPRVDVEPVAGAE